MTRLVLGVDASVRHTGWALLEGLEADDLNDYGTIERQTVPQVFANAMACKANADDLNTTIELAIEEAFAVNVKITKALVRAATAWEVCIEIANRKPVTISRYYPSQWRAHIWCSKGRITSDEWKQYAFEEVKRLYGITDISEHAAEAILIARAHLIATKEG